MNFDRGFDKIEKVAILLLLFMLCILITFNSIRSLDTEMISSIKKDYLEGFTIIFLSTILEAIPFVMIGAFISSIIQIFVSEETIAKIIPKNRYIGLVVASLMGIVFPVCECAIVPIVRRLIKKGVPIHLGITFMLAVPIVNPVVLASTYYAFSNQIYIVFLRGFLGWTSAMLIGHVVGILQDGKNPFKKQIHNKDSQDCHHSSCGCGHEHSHHDNKNTVFSKLNNIIDHASLELYDVGKLLIIGAFLSAISQIFVPREWILSVGRGQASSIVMMMILAFVLSLCSEADAFIAKTFLGQFTTGSIVGFLILGPMLDIKNIIMLSGSFKPKFILKHSITIILVCFMMAMMINIMGI